jgi:hypothetical protein
MCDTMYVGPTACLEAQALFGKNSDRSPDEPQAFFLIGRRKQEDAVRIGRFPLPDRGLSYALSKPSWISGGEMGLNEAGLAIGNEAVFSRFPAAKDGVLGMDILRATLASARDADEALRSICEITEQNDQGGNSAYRGTLRYCNSYLIADPTKAYVLETAGRRWAWKPADPITAISNAYSIETDFKRLDAKTRKEIAPVNDRAACSDESDAGRKGRKESWRNHVESRMHLRFTHGDERRRAAMTRLSATEGGARLGDLFAALRSHEGRKSGRPLINDLRNICVHSGGIMSQATTASMAVEYRASSRNQVVLWFTGTSYPCLSLYKPILLVDGEFLPLWTDYEYVEDSPTAYAHWKRQWDWLKAHGKENLFRDKDVMAARDATQASIEAAVGRALQGSALRDERSEINAAVKSWYESLPGW